MIEVLKSFLDKCDNNDELTLFAEGLVDCWMNGYDTMYWCIKDNNNLEIIKDFFKKLYQRHENFYSIKEWFVNDNDRDKYEIKWYLDLEEISSRRTR